ncbi:unnamed protein product [Meloidogyne enterolobii]|uniref:Uncharacterized protein n=1 Tax=Meloidogyne enterolobii TaxID=390850 RepID=A0ACB1AGG6_MELEN
MRDYFKLQKRLDWECRKRIERPRLGSEKVVPESKERTSFWELQQTKIAAYVEEVLSPHFSPLIQFVNECEPLIESNHSQLLARYTVKVVQIVRTFSAEWRRSVEAINNEILHSFTNLKNAANILQVYKNINLRLQT